MLFHKSLRYRVKISKFNSQWILFSPLKSATEKNYEIRNVAQNDEIYSNFFLMPHRFCSKRSLGTPKIEQSENGTENVAERRLFCSICAHRSNALWVSIFLVYNNKEFKRIFDKCRYCLFVFQLFDTECLNHSGVFYVQLIYWSQEEIRSNLFYRHKLVSS